jgi:ribosomal-protein-alanine N-acetyltransferase
LSRVVAGEAELLLLAVKKSAQRRGVGEKLVARFISDAASRGAERLHLEVRDGNHAVGLYKRHGFDEVGRRKDYYSGATGQRFDALTLARDARL